MKKGTLILIVLVLTYGQSFAQAEASNWYFGENSGIRFNANGTVSPLSNGKLSTIEGCATISDSNGNLLFYTDGINVWNKNHEIMPNGTDLYGDTSSTQSAIIVPKPGDPDIYYIFTVDTQVRDTDPDHGFNYSLVDMSLESGLGNVTVKNINLLPKTTEKVTAVVKDCISQSIWVITLAPKDSVFYNTFYAYEVTSSGLNTTPVVSSFSHNIEDRRGYLKLSPDGNKLVCSNATSGLFIYDFDKTTGSISNEEEITINFSLNGQKPQVSYGVEFSQSSQVLYVSSFYQTNNTEGDTPSAQYGALLQYDLNASNISDSEIVIDHRQVYRGALQLGPNGKIYRAMNLSYDQGQAYLSTINNPNVIGTGCNYINNSQALSAVGRQGLPPFITSFFSEKIDIIGNNSTSTDLYLCNGESYTLQAPQISGATYVWSYNGSVIPNSDYFLDVTADGLYKVFIDPNTGDCSQTLEGLAQVTNVTNPIANNYSLTQCDPDLSTPGITTFNLTEANDYILPAVNDNLILTFYTSQDDALKANNPILNIESYQNTIANQTLYTRVEHSITGCFATATLNLNTSNTTIPVYNAPPVCDELSTPNGINTFNLEIYKTDIANLIGVPESSIKISFYETLNDALTETNNITEYQNTIPYSQNIYYRVETLGDNACYGINKVALTIEKLPSIVKSDTAIYCLNQFPDTITINAGLAEGQPNDYTYLWSTGETTYEIDINNIGTYSVTVTNQAGCSDQRSVEVLPSNLATIDDIVITDASSNNTITVIASGEGTYEYALLDSNNKVIRYYQDSPVFENLSPGFYTIHIKDVKNNCGIINKEVSVIGFPKFFTPNNDGVNDTWQIYGVSELFQPNTKIYIYNRYGKLLKELDPLGEGWNGEIRGKKLPNDDYWFSVKLQDGRIFKDHFSLKR